MPKYTATRTKNLPNYKSAEVKFTDLEKAKRFIGKKGKITQHYKNGNSKLILELPEKDDKQGN